MRNGLQAIRLPVLLLLFVVISCPSWADEKKKPRFDIGKVQYIYVPASDVPNNMGADDLTYESHSMRVTGQLPYFIKETKTLFINGINYQLMNVILEYGEEKNKRHYDLHTIQYNFRLVQMLPKNWNVVTILNPAISSDLRGFSSGDIRANSGIMFGHVINDEFNLQLGVVYSSNFGEDMILPSVGMYYQTEKLRLRVHLPAFANIWYRPHHIFEIGFINQLDGSQYHIHDEDTDVDYVKQTRFNLGPALRLYPYKGLFVQAWGGCAAYRKFEAYKDNSSLFDASPDPNWFAGFSTGYAF